MDFDLVMFFRKFFDQAEIGMGWADVESKVKYVNPALARMLALEKPEDVYGQSVLQFYDPETMSKLENVIFAAVMDKGSWSGELTLISKKGERFNTDNYLFALKDETGKVISFGNIVILKK